jgi:hypothetical protein
VLSLRRTLPPLRSPAAHLFGLAKLLHADVRQQLLLQQFTRVLHARLFGGANRAAALADVV